MNNSSDIALRHLRERFASLDRSLGNVRHHRSTEAQHQEGLSTESSSVNDGSDSIEDDLELRPYLFRTFNGITEDDIQSISSNSDREIFNRRRVTREPRRKRGLSITDINQLPLMYYSHYVFPHALRCRESLASILQKTTPNVKSELLSSTATDANSRMTRRITNQDSNMLQHSAYQLGTRDDPIDIENDQSSPSLDNLVTERRLVSTMRKRSSSSLFGSFFPRLMRSRDPEFLFPGNDTTTDIGERLTRPVPEVTDRSSNQYFKSSRGFIGENNPKPLGSLILPKWQRLKVCFGAT